MGKAVLATHNFLSKEDFIEIKEFINNFNFETLDVYCLLENEKVIGFLALQNKKIEMLFLEPKFIGRGLGKKC